MSDRTREKIDLIKQLLKALETMDSNVISINRRPEPDNTPHKELDQFFEKLQSDKLALDEKVRLERIKHNKAVLARYNIKYDRRK